MTLLSFILQALLPLALFGNPDGSLSLTYSWKGETYIMTSPDAGDTWETPAVIPGLAGNLPQR